MAPLYEVVMLTKAKGDTTNALKTTLKSCATLLWERGAVLADVRPWGQRELAYRIRKQGTNHYHAQYTSLNLYCSPKTLTELEQSLRTSDHVLRWMVLKQDSTPKLDREARFPSREVPAEDLQVDAAETARWEYRNLVMQRVFEGRSKQELIAEQLVRHRFQKAQQRPPPAPLGGGPRLADLRPRSAEGGVSARKLSGGAAAEDAGPSSRTATDASDAPQPGS